MKFLLPFALAAAMVVVAAISSSAQNSVNSVDFKNFTYPAFCAGEEPEDITVRNGSFSRETVSQDGYTDRFYFEIIDIAIGDLDGDGRDEAVVLSVCNTGGTGRFSEGYVFAGGDGGNAELIDRIGGGDRAYGGLRSARISGGILSVESNDVSEEGGACCPEFIVTTRYKLDGGKLVVQGTPSSRPVYPVQRLSFARGASSTSLTLKVVKGEGRRLVVGARAGQTLTVSVNTKHLSLRLLEDADVQDGVSTLTARLPKTGDYTIEIQNYGDTDANTTVRIGIR
jgi:hypothetical protein